MYVCFVALNATPRAMNTRAVEKASATDDELHKVRRTIKTGCFDDCKPYTPIAGELCHRSVGVTRYTHHSSSTPGTSSGTRRTPGLCWHEAEAQNERLVARHGQSSGVTLQILSWLSDGGTT